MGDEFEFDEDDDAAPTKEELAVWLSEFMSQSHLAENLYRRHFCDLVANRVFREFGDEGLCELMMSIDRRGNWISDIILESHDIDDIVFKKYGVYDDEMIGKARQSASFSEMNEKIWKLRRRYAKLIADEIVKPSGEQATRD
jgi:hypothetical protein